MLDGHTGSAEPRLPSWKFNAGHGEGDVQRTGSVMGREIVVRQQRDARSGGTSAKEEQNRLRAGIQGHEALGGDENVQTEGVSIELRRSRKVVAIEGRFEEPNWHGHSWVGRW